MDNCIQLTHAWPADCHLEYLNKEVRCREHRKSDEQVLAIEANIAALPADTTQQQCRLRLLDTPGTNEANEDRLRYCLICKTSQVQSQLPPAD